MRCDIFTEFTFESKYARERLIFEIPRMGNDPL